MVSDHYTNALSNFRNLLTATIEPVERVAALPVDLYNWIQQDYTLSNQLSAENHRLKTENLLLKAQQQQMKKLQLEVERLNRLLGTASQFQATDVQIASVIAYSQTPFAQYVILNKGSLDNIQIHQSVIDAKGLIGQITSVTPTSCRVQLITDPEIQVPVRIQRTGQRGILNGIGHEQLSLLFIPSSSSIKVGDILETSGLGEIFPEGRPVATISKVESLIGEPYYKIAAEPIADLTRSQRVLILSPRQEVEHD